MPDFSAVYGNKSVLTAGILAETHILTQPAFNASALVVIAASAFICKISSALKSHGQHPPSATIPLNSIPKNTLIIQCCFFT